MKRTVIRALRAGEATPEGEPRRYADPRGYTKLRWRVEPGSYVETWERDASGNLLRSLPSRQKRIDRDRVIELHGQGLSQPKIARQLECDPGAVSRILKAQGVKAWTASDHATPLDDVEVIRRFEGLEGYANIARSLGVSERRVRSILEANGFEIQIGRRLGAPGNGKAEPSFAALFRRAMVEVRQRSNGQCEARISPRCGGGGQHGHHRKLRSQGGVNDLATLLHVCHHCHSWIHGHPTASYDLGLLVRSTDDPATIIVRAA